jgi:hypothetical protein
MHSVLPSEPKRVPVMSSQIVEGSRVTTRYYGGYEAVIVRQIHESYLIVVVRFGGAAKSWTAARAQVFCRSRSSLENNISTVDLPNIEEAKGE